MDPNFRRIHMDPLSMDERLKNAVVRGDVGFLREVIASEKPFECFKLEFFPRDGTDAEEVGGNMFYLAAINGRVEFIREALELLPFSVVHELLTQRNIEGKTPFVEDFLLQPNEHEVLVRLIEDFYERRNPMDRHLKNAAIQGDVEFLRQALASDRPVEYFKSTYFRCPTRKEKRGNIFHLAAHHGRVEFFKAAMKILPISHVDLDNLLWQPEDDKCEGRSVLGIARWKCQEIMEVMEEIYRGRNSMDDQLKKAAIEGDVEFLRKAVASNVNKPNAYFQSLHCVPDPSYRKDRVGNMFHLAAWNKREEFLREAMEMLPEAAGVDVHLLLCQQDHPKFKRNPLHVAAREGYNKIVKAILNYYDHHDSLISTPASSLPQPTKAMAMAMDCRSVKPWLVKDIRGNTPLYYVMKKCREECALKLLSMDSELFSHMDDCTKDGAYNSIFIIALRRGFSKVILKFWESVPDWHTFDKRVLACALGVAPNCSDEIFRLVLNKNLQIIKDRDFYRVWSPLASWVSIGKLYPFEYVLLKEEFCVTDLRGYIVDMIPEENPLYYVALSDCDEDRGVQIATILVDAWKKEIEQLSSVQVELPWFATRRYGGTVLEAAILKRREKVALYFLSFEKIELRLGVGGQVLFLAIKHKCHDIAQKILDLVNQHGLKTLLTSNIGRTALHNAPKCKEDFLKQLVKRYPELMKQTDDDGVTVLHSWMEIGELWPFQCILNKDEFSLDVRQNFGTLLGQKTDDKSWNPLHIAAAFGANGVIEHTVRFVFEAIPGQDLYFYRSAIEAKDIEGNTAVDIALSTGREQLALYFLSKVLPYASSDNYLFKAIDKQCHSVVEFLLGEIHGSGWAKFLRMGKQNVLHIASKCTEKNAKLIVERWPELINEQNENGKTPLETASEIGANWLLKLILEKERSSILNAPMAWVKPCERGDLSTILTFTENTYFRYICREHEDTPLHHVKFKDYNEYQELLKCEFIRELKNARDIKGDTPLHKAIRNQNKDLAEILFSMGDVEWNIKNKDGKTAMDLLEEEACKDPKWDKFCNAIGVDPRLKITYIPSRRDVTQMREPISFVAALFATITFTAGFTLPGGFNDDSGEAIFAKKAAFWVFLIADTYAMCCSMLILFSIIWSMVCDSKRSSFLADRSLRLLKHSLYGTFLAFMSGVYTVTYKKSLWIAIVVIIMCSLAVILAQRRILYKMFGLMSSVTEKAHKMQVQLPSSWKQWTSCVKKWGKQRGMASNNQGQDEEAASFTNQSTEHQEIRTPANIYITNVKMRRQQLLMIDQSEQQGAEPLGEQSKSKLDSIVEIKEQYG